LENIVSFGGFMGKRLLSVILALIIVFVCQSAFAADSQLLITRDKAITDKWFKIRTQDGPAFNDTNSVLVNQEVAIVVFYMKPGFDGSHRAKILLDLKIVSPDGSIGENKNIKVVDAVLPEAKIVRLSEQIPKVTFDTPGTYNVQVTVRDDVAKTVQTHKKVIDVKEYTGERYFTDKNQFFTWINTYYQKLSPEKAIDGVILYAHLDTAAKNKTFPQACVFFGKIFNDNQYLIPYLLKAYKEQDADTRLMIMVTLPYINYDFSEFVGQLSDGEKRFYSDWQKRYFPFPEDEIRGTNSLKRAIEVGIQLDMLWYKFFASGEYQPIRRLVDVLEWSKYKGSLEKFKQTQTASDEENAAKEVAYKTAKWSLGSNAKQHRLVRDYCMFILENEQLSPEVKQELKEILVGL
jgi:PKD repeat protein